MSAAPSWSRVVSPRARRRSRVLRSLLLLTSGAALFGLGVAVGDALDDNADPERSQTQILERTLGPLPLSAPPTVTVTLTREG